MDANTFATIATLALGSLLPAAITYLRGSNRKARHRVRLLELERDERDTTLLAYRTAIKLHNAHYHDGDKGRSAPLPQFPPHLDRDYLQGLIDDVEQ